MVSYQLSYAQSSRIDSLRGELTHSERDSNRVILMGELAYELRAKKSDSSIVLSKQGRQLARELGLPSKETSLLRLTGIAFYFWEQPDSAQFYFELAKAAATAQGDLKNLSNVVNNLGNLALSQEKFEEALAHYKQSYELKKKLHDLNGQTVALNNMGTIYLDQGKYSKAKPFYREALTLQQQTGNKTYEAGILQNLAIIALHQNQIDDAIEQYHQALEIMRDLGNKSEEAWILSELGTAHLREGHFTQGLGCFLAGLEIYKQLDDHKEIADLFGRLGSLYQEREDYSTALDYYQRSLAIRDSIEDTKGLASSLGDIGRIHVIHARYDTALTFLYQALRQFEQIGLRSKQAIPLYNIGFSYQQVGKIDSASIYFQSALDIAREGRSEFVVTQSLIGLGEIALEKGFTAEAGNFFHQALTVAEESGLRPEISTTAQTLYQYYKKLGDSRKALSYLELHKGLQDSLFNEANTRELVRVESDYRLKQQERDMAFEQEKEILQYNNRLKKQQNLQYAFAGGLLFVLLFLLVGFRYYQLKRRANEKLTLLNAEILEQKTLVETQKNRLQDLDLLKSRFFTNISHEFRTPLTVIMGMADQLRKNPVQWREKGTQLIQRNAQNILTLINQILDLRKLESGTLQVNWVHGNIIPFIRYITESFHSLSNSNNILLRIEILEGDIQTDYDPEKFRQILSNLLSNAIKYSTSGGQITVSVDTKGIDEIQTDQQIPSSRGPFLSVLVRDTGKGIAPDSLSQVFDRFYQVDDVVARAGGTGIGLALTHELVKQLGGAIHVSSEVGKGSDFRVYLPIQQQAGTPSSHDVIPTSKVETLQIPIPLPALNSPASEVRLLLIEDNIDVVEFLSAFLQDQYQLFFAYNGQTGIEKAWEIVPDLIISDVMMPEKDGLEVCDILKNDERSSHIPIVLLTAKADVQSRIAGLRKGADAYMQKPFNQEELIAVLQNLLIIRQNLQAKYGQLGTANGGTHPLSSEISEIDPEDTFLEKLRNYLEANIETPKISPDQVCKHMGMSRTNLHRKLTALTGLSLTFFIRQLRLHKAKKLLKNSSKDISEIAYTVGFADPKYFSRVFAETFQESPSEYRKR